MTPPAGAGAAGDEGREHWGYADENGEFDECIEDCPGCHWEGNAGCEAIQWGCDICDPDGDLRAAALVSPASAVAADEGTGE